MVKQLMVLALSLGIAVSCSTPPPTKKEKKPDPKESFAPKYKDIDAFLKWISEGESGKSKGKKLKKKKSQIVKAVDGAEVVIDGKKQECYAYKDAA